MLISRNYYEKSNELGVSLKTRLPPGSFSFKHQATKHTTVKIAAAPTTSIIILLTKYHNGKSVVTKCCFKSLFIDIVLSIKNNYY